MAVVGHHAVRAVSPGMDAPYGIIVFVGEFVSRPSSI
jgi:hypothetical protein